MSPDEQTRHEAAHGWICGAMSQLRMSHRSENYREIAISIYWLIAFLAEEEARALEGETFLTG
jgi:hypothetical protein